MDDRDKSLAGVEGRDNHEDMPKREQWNGTVALSPCLGLHEADEKGTSEGQPSLTHPKGTCAEQETARPSAEEGAAVPVRQGDTHQEWRAQLKALQAQVAAQQSEIAELRKHQDGLVQAFASQQASMAEAEQERRREKEEAGRLVQEVSQLSAELSAVRTRLADRFLWVKLLGQMFAPFAPEGTAGNVTGDGCAAMSERQMEQLVEHFVSGILDSHLNRFRSHVDEQLSVTKTSLDERSRQLQAQMGDLHLKQQELERRQGEQQVSIAQQSQSLSSLDSRLGHVSKEKEGISLRVDMLARGMTVVQDGLADVKEAVKETRGELQTRLTSMHGHLEEMQQQVLQRGAEEMKAFRGTMERRLQETAEEQSLLRQDVQHVAAQVDAMVMKVSHEATDAENTTAAMIEDFKKMQYVLEQKICDASLPDEFADWSVDYVCSRLKGDHDVPQWHGESLAQVEEVKALVNHFLASHSQENFRRTQGKNFVDCLLIPRRGDRYEPELHRVGGSCLPDKRRNEQEQDFVVDYLNSPGLFLPREPNRPVKAGVTLRRREG